MLRLYANRRAGMTLVELLVVVSILALLAGAALPMLSGASESRRTREASRMITTHISQSQARAIGRTEPAGFWLVPPPSNPSAAFSLDLFIAEVPPAYRGDSVPAVVRGSLSGGLFTLTSGSLAGAVTPTSGDLVRFDGRGPWYSYVTGTQVALLSTAGRTVDNTPWPSSGDHTFEVLRRPIQTGSALTLQDSRCIDLYWSGHGGSDAATYAANTFGSIPGVIGSIAVLFDAVGRPLEIYRAVNGQRIQPAGPIYLLVGRTDRAGQAYDPAVAAVSGPDTRGANWQYPDSYWIAINPSNGLARSAECAGGATSAFASQSYVRQSLFADGR